jgi:integrase
MDAAIQTYQPPPSPVCFFLDLPNGMRLSASNDTGYEMMLDTLERLGALREDNFLAPSPESLRGAEHKFRHHAAGVGATAAGRPTFTPPSSSPAPTPVPQAAPAQAPSPTQPPQPSGERFSAYAASYLGGVGRATTQANHTQTWFILKLFEEVAGDKPLKAITFQDVDDVLATLAKMPSRTKYRRQLKGLTFIEMVAKAKREKMETIGLTTQGKIFGSLRSFFNWCVDKGELDASPARLVEGKRYHPEGMRKKQAFEPEDLELIFGDKLTKNVSEPHKYWVPLIAYFTGMRINEICQLYLDDIVHLNGLPCIHVGSGREGQHLKSKYCQRTLPIHPKLIELGLLRYIEDVKASGSRHLFPGLTWGPNGPGGGASIWFNQTHLRSRCAIKNERKTFHCFRHTWTTLADRAGVPPSAIDNFLGHSEGARVARVHYTMTHTPEELHHQLGKMAFPDLPVKPYDPNWFSAFLKHAVAKCRKGAAKQNE